jgi:SET domain-containing protein
VSSSYIDRKDSQYNLDFSCSSIIHDKAFLLVDANELGNETRLINHFKGIGEHENIEFKKMWVGGCMRVFAVACTDIQKGQELLADYGEDYWQNWSQH